MVPPVLHKKPDTRPWMPSLEKVVLISIKMSPAGYYWGALGPRAAFVCNRRVRMMCMTYPSTPQNQAVLTIPFRQRVGTQHPQQIALRRPRLAWSLGRTDR
jgi:hypothetical protein